MFQILKKRTHPRTKALLAQISAIDPRADRFHTWGITR